MDGGKDGGKDGWRKGRLEERSEGRNERRMDGKTEVHTYRQKFISQIEILNEKFIIIISLYKNGNSSSRAEGIQQN